MQRVEETAYAKLNLTLAVTGRRADGYHTIQSLFQSISLCDRLVLERRETLQGCAAAFTMCLR